MEVKVRAERLSKHIHGLREVELVKIDVEGSEQTIVDELVESSALGKANQCIIDYHHRMNDDPSRLADFLKKFEKAGYDCKLSANYSRVRRFQKILIYFYKDGRAGNSRNQS